MRGKGCCKLLNITLNNGATPVTDVALLIQTHKIFVEDKLRVELTLIWSFFIHNVEIVSCIEPVNITEVIVTFIKQFRHLSNFILCFV